MTKTWEQTKEAAIEAGITSERALEALRKATAPARHAARVVAALSAATGAGEERQDARALLQLEREVSKLQKKPTARSEWARRLGSGRRKATDGAVWDAAIADAIAQAGGGVELDVAVVADLAVRIPECRDAAVTWLMEAAARCARGWAAEVRHSEEDKAELIAAGEAADRIDALEDRQRLILSLALAAIGHRCLVCDPSEAIALPDEVREALVDVLGPVATAEEVQALRVRLRAGDATRYDKAHPHIVAVGEWNQLVYFCGEGEMLVRGREALTDDAIRAPGTWTWVTPSGGDREALTDDAIREIADGDLRDRALAGEMYARALVADMIREKAG